MKKTTQDITDMVIDAAYTVYEHKCRMAQGLAPINGAEFGDPQAQKELAQLVAPLIQSAQTTKQLEVQSVADALAMLKRGKVSVQECLKLVELIKL